MNSLEAPRKFAELFSLKQGNKFNLILFLCAALSFSSALKAQWKCHIAPLRPTSLRMSERKTASEWVSWCASKLGFEKWRKFRFRFSFSSAARTQRRVFYHQQPRKASCESVRDLNTRRVSVENGKIHPTNTTGSNVSLSLSASFRRLPQHFFVAWASHPPRPSTVLVQTLFPRRPRRRWLNK